jgi:hypothetical protein
MAGFVGPKVPSVLNGLILYLDAANPLSYPGSGDIWYDLSGQNAHAEAINSPTFIDSGSFSYWSFDGTDDKFNSTNILQDYKDVSILFYKNGTTGIFDMIWGTYDDSDFSIRATYDVLNPNPNIDDYHRNTSEKVFLNKTFNAVGVNLNDYWAFLRVVKNPSRSGATRYQLSSNFFSSQGRQLNGNIAAVIAYNRELSSTEVLQNYNALKGRFDLP